MGRPLKSAPEIRGEALCRAIRRGRANLTETALILGRSQATIRALCDQREIATFRVGALRYLPLDELDRLRKLYG